MRGVGVLQAKTPGIDPGRQRAGFGQFRGFPKNFTIVLTAFAGQQRQQGEDA
jgi:hypothetical protein